MKKVKNVSAERYLSVFIWVEAQSRDGRVRNWNCGEDQANYVPYVLCTVYSEEAELAVEDIPGFGYGTIGSIEVMGSPDEDGNLYDGSQGYASFYRPHQIGRPPCFECAADGRCSHACRTIVAKAALPEGHV